MNSIRIANLALVGFGVLVEPALAGGQLQHLVPLQELVCLRWFLLAAHIGSARKFLAENNKLLLVFSKR